MENGFVVVDDDEIFETSPEENGGVPNKPVSKEIFDWIDTIVIALVAVVLIFTFFFRFLMLPSLFFYSVSSRYLKITSMTLPSSTTSPAAGLCSTTTAPLPDR